MHLYQWYWTVYNYGEHLFVVWSSLKSSVIRSPWWRWYASDLNLICFLTFQIWVYPSFVDTHATTQPLADIYLSKQHFTLYKFLGQLDLVLGLFRNLQISKHYYFLKNYAFENRYFLSIIFHICLCIYKRCKCNSYEQDYPVKRVIIAKFQLKDVRFLHFFS